MAAYFRCLRQDPRLLWGYVASGLTCVLQRTRSPPILGDSGERTAHARQDATGQASTRWYEELDPDAPVEPEKRLRRIMPMEAGSRVFFWGKRLAIPTSEDSVIVPSNDADQRVPVEVEWFHVHAERHNCKWQKIAFGPTFGAACTDRGEVFFWGSYGLSAGKRRFINPRPLKLPVSSKDPIRDVQCSKSAIWGLTESGKVLVWERIPLVLGTTKRDNDVSPGCRELQGFPAPIKSIHVGPSHAAFITTVGALYCIGENGHGECGVDPYSHPVVPEVRRLPLRRGIEVVSASCGLRHTVAFTSDGVCLSWGDDSKIQLGLGDTRSNFGDDRPYTGSRGYLNYLNTGKPMAPAGGMSEAAGQMPTAVTHGFQATPSNTVVKYGEHQRHLQWQPVPMGPIPLEYSRQVWGTPYPPPDEIVCGDDFTLQVIRDSPDHWPEDQESNRLFCCGENGGGQCGRGMQQQQQTFGAVRLPRNSLTLALDCGSMHCLAVVRNYKKNARRELWGWGSNLHGQVKCGANVICPASRIKDPFKHSGLEPLNVWCGFENSALVVRQKMGRSKSSAALDDDDDD
eukprot:gnl/MRDRNA2_/MRDRNA2_114046_c0_seq1.p1 gnl/MRDRNA2_/MRDRNA2_114046_c0~~gnl/MRDRNA2_/MRDRNA2_114046_c0_seq1.p1  ORF type:complete len:580 (-),score=80.16 gnl/MRDRNA2_/MRDRNA2_114046_c0_seq1:46-1755(-)